jgi:hypothetical protein
MMMVGSFIACKMALLPVYTAWIIYCKFENILFANGNLRKDTAHCYASLPAAGTF